MQAHVLGQLLADREHRVQRRQRVLEDHREVAAARSRAGVAAQARAGRVPPKRARALDGRAVAAAGRAARASTSSCRCRSRRRSPKTSPGSTLVVDAVDDRDSARAASAAARAAPRPRAALTTSLLAATRVRGSNTSRRLSPRKLNASTTVKIASPGNVPIHHHWKYCVPSATIDPHSACGGCAPRPRNERPESSRIAFARSSVASTKIGPATFGRTSRKSVRRLDAPSRPRRLHVLRVADREHEPARRRARTRARRRRRSRAPR